MSRRKLKRWLRKLDEWNKYDWWRTLKKWPVSGNPPKRPIAPARWLNAEALAYRKAIGREI